MLVYVSDRFMALLRRIASVEYGILNWRAASRTERICFFWIASIANKTLPSCSVDFLGFWERIGGIVGGWRKWVRVGDANFGGVSSSLVGYVSIQNSEFKKSHGVQHSLGFRKSQFWDPSNFSVRWYVGAERAHLSFVRALRRPTPGGYNTPPPGVGLRRARLLGITFTEIPIRRSCPNWREDRVMYPRNTTSTSSLWESRAQNDT